MSLTEIPPAKQFYIIFSNLEEAWECGSGAEFIGEGKDEDRAGVESDTEEEMESSMFDSDLYGDSKPLNSEEINFDGSLTALSENVLSALSTECM